MLNFRDIFGSWFRSLFNFVFCFSQHSLGRIWWFAKAWGVLSCLRSGYSQIVQGLDIHMSFCESRCQNFVQKNVFFMKKWSFPNPSRINLGWSLDHQGMKKHQSGSIGSFRNHEKHHKIWKNDKPQNWSRKWRDTIARSCCRSLLGSFGVFSLSFWFNMTLRADRLKSNYLGCWIFEISSPPDLVNFSILFFVFLNICPLEFDDSQNLWAFWVAWGLGTLRLTRLWIYMWVFKK